MDWTHVLVGIGAGLMGQVPHMVQWSKDRRAMNAEERKDERKAMGDEFAVIADRQERRITVLEQDLDAVRKDHVTCLLKQTELMTRVMILENQLGKKPE